ncbi:MAG: cobalamin biosynthesis protein CbiA, partial [Desulfobacteraceae bacterium]|nr:cobalamin biosynthesis protein CbiA [Desulfobacteraceae bacterium]
GINVIVGNYGSGKTETAVNLAAQRKNAGLSVRIADLDLVNPYFRTREARKPLEALGIDVVLPDKQYMHADLPILTPAVAGMIRSSADVILLDAGGDDAGATVLSALKDAFKNKKVSMLQVINPLRPFTRDVKGCIRIKEEIETASNLKVTGIIGNANLIDETTPEIIYDGYKLLTEISRQTGLKIEFVTTPSNLISQLDMARFDCPILRIDRKLNLPWKKF